MPALGRIVNHDPRSRRYLSPISTVQRSILWGHHAPVLEQSDVAACAGYALAQCLNTDKYVKRGRFLSESDATRFYALATTIEDGPESYPVNDPGASGLSVCKAGKQLGYLSSYSHVFGFNHFTAALQVSPLIVGTSWYAGMNNPKKGVVRPTGEVEGGHEYLALGVDYSRRVLTFLNSWGESWGDGGRFYMSFKDFSKLLADEGDAIAVTATI